MAAPSVRSQAGGRERHGDGLKTGLWVGQAFEEVLATGE